ncbi:hypothetical protein Scep_000885 [Stephania cephalantha]|uniref:RING-type domain-containing protein n=1 Tax=Stephania cephalantha TaxID=152367 RepID=A0AAP0LAQ0_9MAGN
MISFISVVILALAGIFLCTRYLVVREQGGHRHADSHLVEVLPCITFSVTRQIDQHARETCAICLEDYREGEKLKVLPCQHGKIYCQFVIGILTHYLTIRN